MLLIETFYYLENQVFGGVNNRDMSLIETCFCLRLYGISFCIPPLKTLKFLLLIESEDAGFLEGSLQFAETAELLLAAAGC